MEATKTPFISDGQAGTSRQWNAIQHEKKIFQNRKRHGGTLNTYP